MLLQNYKMPTCDYVTGCMSLLTEISLIMNVKDFIIFQKQRLLKMIFISFLKSYGVAKRMMVVIFLLLIPVL